ncbi:O-antigen ligase family protein [Modestobacter sp. VKM Ac-2978]|uniref:O-antigen ligase family protein n=1 Tax=Modestobacter sp. VKM Ac-2978 TaxID=3004132 RepID=UPI0022AB3B5F|nr:O-antigen ligase family protein [Modestobacter sp. VKM Ac-2978]MCZ2846587.1 O-antigen ligase family protein [Modestobacter sp. VKM Ac-2978]
MLAFLTGSALSSLAAVGQVALGIFPAGGELVGGDGQRAPGLADHVNDQGAQLAIAIAIGIALLLNRGSARQPIVAALAALCGIGLVLSGSVTGMASAVVAALVVLFRARIRLRTILVGAAGAGLALYIAVRIQGALTGGDPLARLASATGRNGDISTLEIRLRTWQSAWQRILESPFVGSGLDIISGGTYDGVTQAHNIFLLYWYQGGLLLLVALLVALTPAVRTMLYRRLPEAPMHEAAVGGAVAALAYAQTAPIMFQRYFWLPLVLLLVLADQRRQLARDLEHRREPGSAQLRKLTAENQHLQRAALLAADARSRQGRLTETGLHARQSTRPSPRAYRYQANDPTP